MWLRKKIHRLISLARFFTFVSFRSALHNAFRKLFYFVVKRCFWQRNAVPQSSIVPPSTLNGGSTSLNRRTSILNRPAKCHTEKSAQWIYRQQTVGQGAPLGEKQVNLFLFAAMRVTVNFFFYDRSGFHKTFFTTHFFYGRMFPTEIVPNWNVWDRNTDFFSLTFVKILNPGSRGSTPCLVYHNSGRKVLVAFLGRLFFCWLARAQFVSITDTVP